MRGRDLVEVLLVGVVAFGAASAWTRARDGEPVFGLFAPDPLLDWAPDDGARKDDARRLHGELARAPTILAPATGPDIVVIVLDTVRADRMGIYGYDGDTTPAIDRWAAGARVYDRMVSDGAWTVPSHASLFTGKPVIAHGARGTPLGKRLASPLRTGSATVARALREAGYRTVGIAGNRAFLTPMWGLAQGFDVWMCQQLQTDARGLPYTSGDRVTAMARQVLGRERREPVFLFVNYMDAHAPWVPRRGYVADDAELERRYLPYGPGWERTTDRLMGEGVGNADALATWSAAYDGELRFLDEQVGELLAGLEGMGVGPEDYVFVLSDHGEYLGEHDLVEHAKDVYEEVLRVPLLVKGPGYAPGRDGTPIQTHDVASLILAAAGQQPLDGAVRTEDLQVSELYWSRHRDLAETYGRRFDRIRRAFRLGPHKLILGSDGSREAYALDVDPAEVSDLAESGAAWVAELQGHAEAWVAAQTEAPEAEISGAPDTEALRALGYGE